MAGLDCTQGHVALSVSDSCRNRMDFHFSTPLQAFELVLAGSHGKWTDKEQDGREEGKKTHKDS